MDWRTTCRWISQSDTPISNVLQSHCIVIIHEQTRRLESAASREESLDPRGIIYGVQNPLDGWLVQFLNGRVALPGALYPGFSGQPIGLDFLADAKHRG